MKNKQKKRLRFLWKNKCSFWRKKTTCGKVISIQYVFLHFLGGWGGFFFLMSGFCFVLFFCFFSSSFKVNLKVHHRNWRVVSLLAPMGKKRARSSPRQSLWEIRLLPNSFESKTVWSILDSLRALQWFLHFSGSVKFFDKAILSGSVSHSKSIYRTTFF